VTAISQSTARSARVRRHLNQPRRRQIPTQVPAPYLVFRARFRSNRDGPCRRSSVPYVLYMPVGCTADTHDYYWIQSHRIQVPEFSFLILLLFLFLALSAEESA